MSFADDELMKTALSMALANMLETETITVVGSELPGYFEGWAVMRCYPKFPGDPYRAWCFDSQGKKWQAMITMQELQRKQERFLK